MRGVSYFQVLANAARAKIRRENLFDVFLLFQMKQMKQKQIFFEASLTVAWGISGFSIPQENSCGGHAADCSYASNQDALPSDNRIVTYGASLSREFRAHTSTKFNKFKFLKKYYTGDFTGVENDLNILIEIALEKCSDIETIMGIPALKLENIREDLQAMDEEFVEESVIENPGLYDTETYVPS
eukprot:GHVP01017985.1.p1 GENE.GHVP01017985.1~~GHVP01017985.1.p1  ORF type:complete len:185 (+),score=34.72 GHVP01017985.1:457-1011(+)